MPQSHKTRRGTVIVENEQGILLAEARSGMILLPGGQAEHGESRFEAAIRELREETGLIASSALRIYVTHKCTSRHMGGCFRYASST